MDKQLIKKIEQLKIKYQKDGFIILGIFGSYTRGEETESSDIDILYEMTDEFYKKHSGWNIFPVLDKIQGELENELHKHVDLANINALNEVGKKYILSEVKYV